MKYVSNTKDLPAAPHYAAIVEDSIYIPGDGRNDGHGYGAENKAVLTYIYFSDEAEMKDWVKNQESSNSYGKKKYKIINVAPVDIKISVTVELPKIYR